MDVHVWIRSALQFPRKSWGLLLILLGEVCVLTWMWHHPPQNQAVHAFLSRYKNNYVLAWKDEMGEISITARPTLEGLVEFASADLGLVIGRNDPEQQVLESLWVTPRGGAYVVLWKLESDALLNQMTFQNQNDAFFFAQAFRSGAYSRSILGHSILLITSVPH